jgi:signal transduction histidine kinase
MKIELMEFSLENLLADVTSMLSQKAQEKGLEVIVDVSNEIGKNYIGDRHRLAQILINFLSNAIKFTEQGQIFIGVGKEYR